MFRVDDLVKVTSGNYAGQVGTIYRADSEELVTVALLRGREIIHTNELAKLELAELGVERLKVGAVVKNKEGLVATIREVTSDYIYLGERGEYSKSSARRIAFTVGYFSAMYYKQERSIKDSYYKLDVRELLKAYPKMIVRGVNDEDYRIGRIHELASYYDTMELETVTVLATSLEYVTYTRDAIDAIDELKQSLDSGKAVRTITIKRTIFLSRFIKPLPANLTYTTLDRIDERLKELGYNI